MSEWKCCIKEPPETGKKVLVSRKGDIYVAMRLKDHYIPMPFVDHYFCEHLCKPEIWSEINFPEGLTGLTRVKVKVDLEKNESQLMTFAEFEIAYPKEFYRFASAMISSLATIPKPKGMK